MYLTSVATLNAYPLFCLARPISNHCNVRHSDRMLFPTALAVQLIHTQVECQAELSQGRGVINQQGEGYHPSSARPADDQSRAARRR